jgi:hypothetical protein
MPRSCDRMKRNASAGTTAAANRIALAPGELSTVAPPINPPPSAFPTHVQREHRAFARKHFPSWGVS